MKALYKQKNSKKIFMIISQTQNECCEALENIKVKNMSLNSL